MAVSGKYVADYYRKATHTISVGYNVKDVVLGGGAFFLFAQNLDFAKILCWKNVEKNKIDMKLEEHVFVEEEDENLFLITMDEKLNSHSKSIPRQWKITLKKF